MASFALSGCSSPSVEEVATTAASAVKTMVVTPHSVEGVVAAGGMVAAAPGADWTITAPEAGRIAEIPKAEGDRVKTGDLLVRFEIPSLASDVAARRAEAQQAQARVDNAQSSVARLTTLVEHGVAAQKELEDAKRDLAEAGASLRQAQTGQQTAAQLESRTVVRARFAGVIARRAHNPGDMVEATAADVILRVIDPSRLQIVAAVAIPDLVRVQVGRAARVLVPGSDEQVAGRVLTRPAAVDPAGVSADVRIAFDAPTQLAAGTPVRVEIVAEQRANALAVPVGALIREGEEAFVMVAGADNKAHRRKVTLGLSTPLEVQIVSGLTAGELVIVEGHQALPDGADITVSQ
ncbi:MAG: efflux RND transporter periplasmic adaptor subunit [Vicinamibacterales bacterium]